MNQFPRTAIEGVSLPRLVIGTNWFLGYSHQTKARDNMIKQVQGRHEIADVLVAFMERGIDFLYGYRPEEKLEQAVAEAQDRTGKQLVTLGTPHFDLSGTAEAYTKNCKQIDAFADIGCTFCWPHQATTDALVNRRTRTIDGMDKFCAMIRERGMKPGLSTHMPEAPIYADESGLDVASYIQIYNAAGFLMQIEVDWVHRMIWKRDKPVLTIKPLGAGRLPPLVGLAFSWATLRPIDLVCIGCYTPDEAKEVVDISLSILEGREMTGELQKTRSKASL